MALEIIVLILVIVLIIAALAVFWLWKEYKSTANYKKTIEKGMSKVSIVAHRDLEEVMLEDRAGKEKIKFARADIRKGQQVEFIYPASMRKAKLTLLYDGEEQVIEVEPE